MCVGWKFWKLKSFVFFFNVMDHSFIYSIDDDYDYVKTMIIFLTCLMEVINWWIFSPNFFWSFIIFGDFSYLVSLVQEKNTVVWPIRLDWLILTMIVRSANRSVPVFECFCFLSERIIHLGEKFTNNVTDVTINHRSIDVRRNFYVFLVFQICQFIVFCEKNVSETKKLYLKWIEM